MAGIIKALISSLGLRGRILGQFVNSTPWITTDRNITSEQLLRRVVGDVYACVSIVGAAVAESAKPELYVKKAANGRKYLNQTRSLSSKECRDFERRGHVGVDAQQVERVEDHPLLDLLHTINPMPFVGPYEFFEQASMYSDTARFFALIVKDGRGMPVEMWTLPPGPMKPKMDGNNLISHWEYHTGGTPIRFETDEILLHRRSGPATSQVELIMGFPPLQAVFDTSDTATKLTELLNNTITNRAVPPTIITVQGANREKITRVEKAWNRALSGRNSGSNAFVPDTISVQPVGWSNHDLEHSKLLKDIRERICNVFTVPVNFMTDASSNRANSEAGVYKMMRFAVRPRLRRLADTLNQTLVPMFDDSNVLIISFPDPVPEDEELTIKRNVAYVGSGIWTPNEARETEGNEPLPGGDELKPNQPQQFGGFGGPPSQDDQAKQHRSGTDCECNPQVISKQHDGPGEKPQAPGLRAALVRIFQRQLAEILGNFKSGSTDITTKDERPIALLGTNEFDRLILDLDTADVSVIKDTQVFLNAQIELGVANGSQQMRALGFAFELKPEAAIEFVRTEQAAFIRRFATKVNSTTNQALRDQFEIALRLGENIGQIKRRVREVFVNATSARAETIARSETKRALESGQRSSYVKAGVTQMQWIAGPDACPFCQQFDNRIVGTSEAFATQGDSVIADFTLDDGSTSSRTMNLNFSDTPHPPLHPNCTCFIVPVV